MTFACENGSQTSTIAEKSLRGLRRLGQVPRVSALAPTSKNRSEPTLFSRRRDLIGHSSALALLASHHHYSSTNNTSRTSPNNFCFVFCVLCSFFLMGGSEPTGLSIPSSSSTTLITSDTEQPRPTTPSPPTTTTLSPQDLHFTGNRWIPEEFLSSYQFTSQTSRCVSPRYKHRMSWNCAASLSSPAPRDPSEGPAGGPKGSLLVNETGLQEISEAGAGSVSHSQCLLLDQQRRDSICNSSERVRTFDFASVHLPFCLHYTLERLISDTQKRNMTEHPDVCNRTLEKLIQFDQMSQRIACEFDAVITRFDCKTDYSYPWKCSECKAAYHSWVCAMLLPYYEGDKKKKSCRSFCHRVEQRCPYFHPFIKEQYAGEPAFKCIDRNIPDLPSITPNSPHGQEGECYSVSDLASDLEHPELSCDPVVGVAVDIKEDIKRAHKGTSKRPDEGGGASSTEVPPERNIRTTVVTSGASSSTSAATSISSTYLLFFLLLRPSWLLGALLTSLVTRGRRGQQALDCWTGARAGSRRLVTD